jgi:rubrerythrin
MEIEERLTAEHRRKLKEIAEQETRGEVGQAFMEAFIRRFVIALEAAMVLGPLDEAKQELEEHRNALRSTADALQAAREALAKVARHTPVEFPYRVEQAVLWSMRRYLAMSNGDVITPTLQTTRFLAGLEH